MEKPWLPLDADAVEALSGDLGVYQVADGAGTVVYIGYAGGRSLWGLQGELRQQLAERGEGYLFRVEINHQYLSRWEELLKVHDGEHGALPAGNEEHRPRRIGRLSPG
ncbi:MAG: hypothetical protein QF578_15350 [Alphaproteobacteria bacterium]|nr:hypothetical protein [Alphaproteobacteria bacterium]MDP6566202.1 hypothetical protein [Alphaproteobacteria bacterium]MDP6815097.1 hypothetical protein [Alphaproteobacteria bacterium]